MINRRYRKILIVSVLVLISACRREPIVTAPPVELGKSNPAITQPQAARAYLLAQELLAGPAYDSPVAESALARPSGAAPAAHRFSGRLVLGGEATIGGMKVLRGDTDQEPEVSHLPEFDYDFVQDGDDLIPTQRGLIITEHPFWNYILEPGYAWSEPGDEGYSRASFPFALVWKGSNATLNGTMTFLFNDSEVSHVWYQVTQETTVTLRADLWGALGATYTPGQVPDADRVIAAFRQEVADRLPTRPVEEIAGDYPGVDAGAFGYGVPPENMTWYGYVVDGVNYLGGCQTRYGTYPYCGSMRAPSYSTAKSAFVSVALMRLAQKFDPQAPNLRIEDYVAEAADSRGDWSAVTFDNVLDMATGNFQSAAFMADEEQWDHPFWSEEYYQPLIKAAFDWPHSAAPGTRWVYRTSDTFILTRALQSYLESQAGAQADIFDFVVEEVYRPLRMGPGVFSVLRTRDDNWQGQPYGGLGMWWVPDDLAKIGMFLNAQEGKIGGEQILHQGMLSAALQRDADDRGVDRTGGGKYNNAFWADRYRGGYTCEVWVAEMLGYSGIVVALLPNGTTYYYASDGRDFTWDAAVREADKIKPYCP